MCRIISLFMCLLLSMVPLQAAELHSENEPHPSIKHISEHHPRLLISDEILARVHGYVHDNKLAASEYSKLQKRGEEILKQSPVKFAEGDLLEVSRTALKRIYILGMLHQMKPDKKWVARAKSEMLAACAFPSWHPDHFLDTAEMTHAMSIGYDWFYSDLSDTEKSTIRSAIVKLGLNEGAKAFEEQHYFWTKEHQSNWSVVCFGGLLMGVLAIGNDGGDASAINVTSQLLPICIDQLRQSINSYGPDGAWCEGLNYWNYSSIYATTAIASLETSLHSDFNLSKCTGLEKAGLFFIDAVSPTGLCFNFADAVDSVRNSPQLFWLSRRYDLPVLAYEERQLIEHANDKLDPRDLIWFSEAGSVADYKARPLMSKYRGSTQMVAMRTSWTDPNATYFAMKGGDNTAHHGHLDLGTFVLDSDGVRWAIQPGMENYDLPGYFDMKGGASAPRWQYYRTRTAGQNTPLVNGANQDTSSKAPLTECNRAWVNNESCAALDLNDVYKSHGVTKFSRVATFLQHEPGGVFLLDSLSGPTIFDAIWQMHTRATVKVEGSQAILSSGDKKLLLKVLSPMRCYLGVEDVKLAPPQVDSVRVKKVTIRMASQTDRTAFGVLFVPFKGAQPPTTPDFNDLIHAGWNK